MKHSSTHHGMGPRWLALAIVSLWSTIAIGGIEELPPEWREVARKLTAEEFPVRQAAEQQLRLQPSVAVIPWLTELVQQGDPESSLRAMRVLDAWVAAAPLDVANHAETHLERLSQADRPDVGRLASDALAVHQQLRSQRAVEALLAMGAKIDFGPDRVAMREDYNIRHADVVFGLREFQVNQQVEARLGHPDLPKLTRREAREIKELREQVPRRPAHVYFPPRWTGGDAGVDHLRRLVAPGDQGSFDVLIIEGSQVSLEAVQIATAGIENASPPQVRGPSLGVSQNGFRGDDCVIGTVLTGGAASLAGLKPDDQIVSIGFLPVRTFSDLIESVALYQPGDRVPVTYHRGWFRHTVEVTLGDWTDVDSESTLWRQPMDGFLLPMRLRQNAFPRIGPK